MFHSIKTAKQAFFYGNTLIEDILR